MHEFELWAPSAREVELFVDGRALSMEEQSGGWWRSVVEEAGAGSRYGFELDGCEVRPDPRSAFQPDGVAGLSQVVDHESFDWHDGGWRGLPLAGAAIYELHVGTFTPGGTFESAIERIPHLLDLGIDAVELMPVAEFSGDRGWGYDGVDLFAPHHAYGGPTGLKHFIDALHSSGIAVVMDVVYNHLGPAGNYLGEFGPYFSDRHVTNWGPAVNFDGPGSDEVRRFVIDNALMWLRDYRVDGLRLDAVHAIIDDSAVHILEQLADEVGTLAAHMRKPLFVIAESDLNDPRFVRPTDVGGLGLDASWADEWHHAIHAVLTGERAGYYEDFGSLAQLAKALRQAWVYDGIWSSHRGRHFGRPPHGLDGRRFVVFTQNHDQVGNRAVGERSGMLMSHGRLKVAAALMFSSPFTPLVFQGEEWGAATPFLYFTHHSDPDLGQAVSVGRRSEFSAFGWDPDEVPDPQDPASFEASKLNWDELREEEHAGIHDWYRRLLALRRRFGCLSDPRRSTIDVEADEERRTLVVSRGPVKLFVNLSEDARLFSVRDSTEILAASDEKLSVKGGVMVLPPESVVVATSQEG
jgi:maltooligosyltrehalose trehalohydrolase